MRTDRLRQDAKEAAPWIVVTVLVSMYYYATMFHGSGLPLWLSLLFASMFGAGLVAVSSGIVSLLGDVQERYFPEEEGDTK